VLGGARLPGGEDCTNEFLPLRQEAEKHGAMIKSASVNHAPPDETCKLFVAYGQSQLKMIKYIESHQAKCGIPPQIGDQLRAGRKNTEVIQKKVCDAAKQQHPKWLQITNRLRYFVRPDPISKVGSWSTWNDADLAMKHIFAAS
jgi:hypothetical protein